MDQTSFSGVDYSQRLDTCVLASYAVACFPFTGTPVLDYFAAYCRHFKDMLNEAHPERSYDNHFHYQGKPGYAALKELHEQSAQPEFVKARSRVALSDLVAWPTGEAMVEAAIKRADCLLLLFINVPSFPDLPGRHSILVGCDSQGLYYFDTARPRRANLVRGPRRIADLGQLGDAYIVSKKS